jgi:oxygen-dependent protoporphyrinogen oxidase
LHVLGRTHLTEEHLMGRVIVIGAGIAGLGAAYRLQREGHDVRVLESEPEVGGRMRSTFWRGSWIDLGAEFITSNDTGLIDLARDVGVLDQRLEYPGETVAFDVWRDGEAHPLSFTEASSFLRFGAMSATMKARMLRMMPALIKQYRRNGKSEFEPWRAAWFDDESTEDWLNRISPEFLEYAVEPCYELYCGWEPHDLSRAMLLYLTTTYRSTAVFTFPEGLGQLTRAVADRLDVITEARATRVKVGTSPTVEYTVAGQPRTETADVVVVAVPGTHVSDLVEGLDDERARFFAGVRYTPHELPFWTLSERPEGIPDRVFYPRVEDADIAAIGYDRASTDPDVSYFRASFKTGYISRNLDTPTDAHLKGMIEEVARRFPQVPPVVTDGFVSRWREALPIFWPGYLKALDRFVHLPPLEGAAFAGDYLAMPATGAAYVTGLRAADAALAQLG